LAAVLLRQCQRNAFARAGIQATAVGHAEQAKERAQGRRRVGPDLQEIRHHAKLTLNGVEKGSLFVGRGVDFDDVDAAHGLSNRLLLVAGWRVVVAPALALCDRWTLIAVRFIENQSPAQDTIAGTRTIWTASRH